MGRILLLTGTRKGIGRYLAEQYLATGLTVVGCSREASDLVHPAYTHYCLDVADEAAVVRMVADTVRQHGAIDYLLNNAGAAAMNHTLLTPLATLETIFRTNMFGTFLLCREVAKVMQRRKFGRIVNFSTVAVPYRLEGEAAYSASKAAVEHFTRTLAREIGAYGITCNAIGPTPVETDLIAHVPEDKIERLLQRQAVPRFATFSEIKHLIDFFLHENSSMVTGQVVYLGGAG